MFLSRIKFFVLITSLCFLVFCCGFIDLNPLGFTTDPSEPNAVLSDSYSPVIIRFDTAMMRHETESVAQIISPGGAVEGDFVWNENELKFFPGASWVPGQRYVLELSGTIYALDGRDSFVSRNIPFYALSRVSLPNLVSVDPIDGASVEAALPGKCILSLRFSVPMDRRSTEAAFSIDGIGDKLFSWDDDDKVLQIFSEKPLESWTQYRWSVSEKALCRDNAPLAKAASGFFTTDLDKDFPVVVSVVPLFMSSVQGAAWGLWRQSAPDISSGLGVNDAIGIKFSKAMDMEKLRGCVSFDPPLSGRIETVSPDSVVYIPERNPEPESVFELTVNADAKDIRGLRMGENYTRIFTVNYRFLELSGLGLYENSPDENSAITYFEPEISKTYVSGIDSADNGVLRVMLRFSLPFTDEAKKDITKTTLEPFFPGILPGVNLRSVDWLGDTQVFMQWEGLKSGKTGERHYYRLKIPFGQNGISDGNGSFIKKETLFFIEVIE